MMTVRAMARRSLVARGAQGIGGPGGWETGQGLGRGPVSQSCARDLELGTFEPSGLNPRAQTLGLEPRDRTRARVGGVMVRGGRSWLLSRVLSCTVHRLMTYDLWCRGPC